ncbi:hypothetical protein CHS0354_020492 [Potamilus streckersoni]|uniref:Uncharacterized protein n=1 Tax=Potamilus streckersoni TaxID=2493646 RepID=A0AAE0SZN4_9BIVA|nr:hypothetical protein CHS0354_020492 [Potamilus streckersoni]
MAIHGKQIILPYIVRPLELTAPRTAEYHELNQSSCSSARLTPGGKRRCVSTTQLPLIMLERKQNLSQPQDHYGYWKYGTTDWITRLLYTGQVPSTFFEHMSNRGLRSRFSKDRPFLYNVEPTVESPDTRKVQLWEPKKVDRLQWSRYMTDFTNQCNSH